MPYFIFRGSPKGFKECSSHSYLLVAVKCFSEMMACVMAHDGLTPNEPKIFEPFVHNLSERKVMII